MARQDALSFLCLPRYEPVYINVFFIYCLLFFELYAANHVNNFIVMFPRIRCSVLLYVAVNEIYHYTLDDHADDNAYAFVALRVMFKTVTIMHVYTSVISDEAGLRQWIVLDLFGDMFIDALLFFRHVLFVFLASVQRHGERWAKVAGMHEVVVK